MSRYKVHPNSCRCRNCRDETIRRSKEKRYVSGLIICFIVIIIVIVSIL